MAATQTSLHSSPVSNAPLTGAPPKSSTLRSGSADTHTDGSAATTNATPIGELITLSIALLIVSRNYHHAFIWSIHSLSYTRLFIMTSSACSYALGMQSGAINDSQIKASSFKSLWTRPSEARLYNQG